MTVRPDDAFTALYPDALNTRVTVVTRDGRTLVEEQVGYEGGLASPMSWERAVAKFHWLSERHADGALRGRIIDAVQALETVEVSQLMKLLAQVDREPVHPARHPGIQ